MWTLSISKSLPIEESEVVPHYSISGGVFVISRPSSSVDRAAAKSTSRRKTRKDERTGKDVMIGIRQEVGQQ